jgi:flagellar hook-associated protein 1 FlgK
MTTMSQLVDVSFIAQRNGGVIAATKGGLVLSLTNPAPQFQMTPSIANAQTYYPGGGIQPITLLGQDVTKSLTGGQIGANLTLRDTTLPTNQGELDEFANTLQSRFSAQGLQLFTPPAGGTAPPPAQARYIGYAATIAVNPLVSANPRLVRDGTTAVAASPSGPSAFTPNPAGGPASFGTLINRVLTYALGANVQAGVPQPPPATTGLGPLGSLQAQFAPPPDLASFATSLVTAQSTDVASAQSSLQTETTLQTTLQARATATSGVDTDAELSLMVILQKDYGATAKIIAAAQTMWNQLLTMIP